MRQDLYIVNLETQERLQFQTVPDSMSQKRTAKEGQINVTGRNNPIVHYQTGTDTISFDVSFFSEQEDREDIKRKINWLRSLAYNDGYLSERPRILLIWGNYFGDEVWYLTSVEASNSLFNRAVNYMPQIANVSLQFTYVPAQQITFKDVQNG